MQSFEDVLREFEDFLQTASYLEVLPCRWGYVRLFNEGAPINFYAVLCRTPQELYDTLENDLAIEKEVQNILHRNITFQCQLLLCHFHRFWDSLYLLS